MTEFKAFKKIKHLRELQMSITQKIHGTNAHVLVYEEDGELKVKVGSKNRYITPENDNFGFATFVYANRQEFIDKLGLGRHDGEWCGKGINSGEGLNERKFLLFEWWRWQEVESLPPQTGVVPLLYHGPIDMGQITEAMHELKTTGSKLSEGFMSPEGVVVMIGSGRYKKVFLPEETKWSGSPKKKGPKRPKDDTPAVDYSYLLQPIRLEKLLSRDEAYVRNYPQSLGLIVKDYMADLIEEGEIKGDVDEIKVITKGSSRQVFTFIKEVMENGK